MFTKSRPLSLSVKEQDSSARCWLAQEEGLEAGICTPVKEDLTREFSRLARRYELQARAALAQGHGVTAGDGFFSASVMCGAAQWPIFANTELNLALERKKEECSLEFTKRADHRIEAVEIPCGDKFLAAYLHFPPGYQGGKLPCLVMVSGMDAFKELQINASADRFLHRGFACLMLDGPGQGTSLTREVWYDPNAMLRLDGLRGRLWHHARKSMPNGSWCGACRSVHFGLRRWPRLNRASRHAQLCTPAYSRTTGRYTRWPHPLSNNDSCT